MRVVNSDTKLECYAPGIVQVLPQDETVQAKFYTVMMYNGQQVCVHSTSRLVPHGSCWYNWSVFEILIFCSLEHTCIFLIIIISSLIFSNINIHISLWHHLMENYSFTLGNCHEKLCHENQQIQIWICNSLHCRYSNAKPREVMTMLLLYYGS